MKYIFSAAMAFLAVAASAAGAFRASDQSVLPAVARVHGAFGSFWVTDLTLYNPGSVTAVADLAFLPTGGGDNTGALTQLVQVGPLAPGQTLILPDVLLNEFGQESAGGALLIFGSELNAPGLIAPLLSSARVYNSSANGTNSMNEPALPYYDEANALASSIGADAHLLIGLEEDTAFRTNVGVWNGSDPTTSIVVRIDFFDSNGLPVGSQSVALAPLGHVQLDGVLASFGVSGGGFSARATLESFASSGVSPRAYFFAYGVVIDNHTNDPTFVEPSFPGEEPVDCIFNSGN